MICSSSQKSVWGDHIPRRRLNVPTKMCKTGFLEPGVVIVPPRDVPVKPVSYCERSERAHIFEMTPPLCPLKILYGPLAHFILATGLVEYMERTKAFI